MPPEQSQQQDTNPEPLQQPEQLPTNTSSNGVSKKTFAIVATIAGVIIAILLAIVLFMLTNSSDESNNNGTDSSAVSESEDEVQRTDDQRVVAAVTSADPDIVVELLEPRRAGNTLVANYRLVNDSEEEKVISAFDARVYTIMYGISEERPRGGIAEPYAVSADGQKYGLARDDQNNPLASQDVRSRLEPGEKISGYVTLTLPPSGSNVSIFLGDFNAFNDVQITY